MKKIFEFEKDKCCYYNCNDESIKAHAISKRISLSVIAENNHLLYFSPKQFSKYLKKEFFKSISIHQSTISKSFCKKHDDMFESLDRNEISTVQDILLQSYRMVSILLNEERSSYYSRFNDSKRISKEDVISFLKKDEKYNELLEKLDDQIIDIVKRKIFFEIQEKISSNLSVIEDFSIYLIHLFDIGENKNKLIEINKFYAFSTDNMEYSFFIYKTDFQIPIAINTMGKLIIDNETFNYYINIIPYTNSNIIFGVIPKQLIRYDYIVNSIEQAFIDKLSVLNFVESIVVSNDGWYMQPSIINSMKEEKRNIFMKDCMFQNERKFYEAYDLSIFDDLRKDICLELNKTDELEKINFIPKREEYQDRYINMLKKIEKDSITSFILD